MATIILPAHPAAGGGGGGNITFVGAASDQSPDNDPNVSADISGTGYQADDVAIAWGTIHQNLSTLAVSGYTLVDTWDPDTAYEVGIWYKVLTASESNPSMSSGNLNEATINVAIFRGVDTANVLDTSWVRSSHSTVYASDLDGAPPGITTANAGSALVALYMSIEPSTTISAFGAPSGFTLTGSGIIGSRQTTAIAYQLDAGAAAAKTPSDWTHSFTNGAQRSFSAILALRST